LKIEKRGTAMTQEVDIKVQDGVQVIRLLRADKKNALTGPMYDAMSAALDAAEKGDAVAAHVFIGSGGVYTAGNDINDFMRRSRDGSQDVAPSQMFIQRLPKVTRPMIAAVDGLAVGVGVTMLLHCDLVYFAEGARLRLPFVPLGVVPEAASSHLLPLTVGWQRAAELIYTGAWLDAAGAVALGLGLATYPSDTLLAAVMAKATAIATAPLAALRESKRLLLATRAPEIRAARAREDAAFARRIGSLENAEAITAFLGGRKI
jgi:enoyl-CoA hydratase/carnithine racemase